MAIENLSDEQSQKIGKRLIALIIPFLSGFLFSTIFTTFLYFWSQTNEPSRRLDANFSSLVGIFGLGFIAGFLVGLLPTISILLKARKSITIMLIVVSILILIISFCGCSWISMWMINP